VSLDDTSCLPGEDVHEANARPSSGIDCATLLERVYGIDSLACPRCGGRLKLTDVFEDKAVARAQLEQRGLPRDPPARVPPDDPGSFPGVQLHPARESCALESVSAAPFGALCFD
jgi:hypothetical protein